MKPLETTAPAAPKWRPATVCPNSWSWGEGFIKERIKHAKICELHKQQWAVLIFCFQEGGPLAFLLDEKWRP